MEDLENFYKNKFNWLPDNLKNNIGHFNLFRLEPFVEGQPTNIPYERRDFYKIMLVKGQSKIHFADKVVEIEHQALSFSNPQIPYKWEHLDSIREGVYCIFNAQFFHKFGEFHNYEVFQPDGEHIFELTEHQTETIHAIFNKIETEFNSDYKYKYDAIRNFIFELLHFALKLNPSGITNNSSVNASKRIVTLFTELLERQFPLDDSHPQIKLRAASDFASTLNIHANHLNKAVKEVTGKTTTQIITERILQESKVLLKYAKWDVSEIAYALDFKEATHFSNFFKKHVDISPSQFRTS